MYAYFSLCNQPVAHAGLAGCMGGVLGMKAGFGGVPTVHLLSTEVCCRQKDFWAVMLKRVFE